MKIEDGKVLTNIRVYDLEESLIASGYPMRTNLVMCEPTEKDITRVKNLTRASRTNGAHNQCLTGIRVSFDLTFTNKAWVEAERYRFLEFVSSQSTMHRITKFDIRSQYNEYVDPRIIDIMDEKVSDYNASIDEWNEQLRLIPITAEDTKIHEQQMAKKYLEILYSNPAGFKLTARMTTNYRCLLNIYNQRHDHRLPEWHDFCDDLLKLPLFKELIQEYGVNV